MLSTSFGPASLSRAIAPYMLGTAMMTVLIGMFLLGLLIALGTWTVSWSNHVKSELLVKVDFSTSSEKGGQATHAEENAVSRRLSENPLVSKWVYISRATALAEMKKTEPELTQSLPFNPLPDSIEVTPNCGRILSRRKSVPP